MSFLNLLQERLEVYIKKYIKLISKKYNLDQDVLYQLLHNELNKYNNIEDKINKYFIKDTWSYIGNYKGIQGNMYPHIINQLIKKKYDTEKYKDGLSVILKVKNKKDKDGNIIKEKLYLTVINKQKTYKLDNLNLE